MFHSDRRTDTRTKGVGGGIAFCVRLLLAALVAAVAIFFPVARAGRRARLRRESGVPRRSVNPKHPTDPILPPPPLLQLGRGNLPNGEAIQWRNEVARLSRVAMLGELSGSLAHELNQPLTSILSNAQAAQRFLAREQPDLREVNDILKDIVAEGKRAGEVIWKLRALFKKGQIERQMLDVNEVLQDVLKLVRSELIDHGISLNVRLAQGLPTVRADRVQLQQVLLNLIKNACDAMEEAASDDKRLAIVSLTAPREAGVRVSIRDRGCGVPGDRIERIFEPFYTTKPAGMGLGLAVCRTIVRGHDGQLWLENNADQGVTAHLVLRTAHETRALD